MVKEATLQIWLVSFERCKSDAKPSEYLTKIGVVAQLARRLFDMPPETAWYGLCRLGCCWVAGGWLARLPRDATNSTFVLCFTRFEAICGVPGWMPRHATNSTFALCFTGIQAT